jgi:hypothetical protein
MALQIQGNSGMVAEVDGAAFRALRFSPRPVDHGALGAYCIGQRSGIIPAALAANSEVFQFRWSDASRMAVVRKIRISASVSTTFFAAGVPMQLDLLKATGWTAAGSGGTRAAPASLLKRRTSMGASLVAASDIGIATTAALTAGTKTLETLALSSVVAGCPITASLNGTIIVPGTILWQAEVGDGEHPLVLVQNEGFVITVPAVPATGTWVLGVAVDWAEVTAY